MIIAMVAGILTNLFDKESDLKESALKKPSFSAVAPTTKTSFSVQLDKKGEETCGTGTGSCCAENNSNKKKKFSFMSAMKYAFVTLLGDIAKPLFWGLLLGALITVAIPENLSGILKEYSWLSYLIVIVIAVPMYVCATASLPIAAALMLSGVSAGAAFVFLSAGPATNTVTITVVKKMLGNKALYIYLGVISVGSILFGLGLDLIFDKSSIDPKSLINMGEDVGVFSQVSSIVLWGFLFYFMAKPFYNKKDKSCST